MPYNAEREQKRRQKVIDEGLFRCDLCDKNFGRARELKRHLAGKHHLARQRRQDANGRPYPCRFCDYRAKTKSNLDQHEESKHIQTRPFACPHCDQTFSRQATLDFHITTHTSEKVFKCSKCDYEAATMSQGLLHERTQHLEFNPDPPSLDEKEVEEIARVATQQCVDHMLSHKETHDKLYIHYRNSGITKGLMFRPTTVREGWDPDTVLFLFGSRVQPWGCKDEATRIEALIEKYCLERPELVEYLLNERCGGGETKNERGDGGGYVYAVLRKNPKILSHISQMKKYGTRREVWSGNAEMTKGGLKKDDLKVRARDGKLVSKKKSALGKASYAKNQLKPKTKEELAAIRPKKRSS